MTKKRASKSSSRGPKAKKPRSFLKKLLFLFFKLSLLGLVLGGIGLIYLDIQIKNKFEGKRWALPAKVYARPLELYPGQVLSKTALKQELQGLGYRFVNQASQPGMVEWAANRARIYTRGFSFPDSEEAAKKLLLSFRGDQLVSINDSRGQQVSLSRLEPILIGGIYPRDNEDRDLIRLDQAPEYLKEALIQIEDRDYYQHFGISLRGIARAMWVNIQARRFVQGGSTLTQQLIKNFYLTSDRTLARKLMEIPMAVLLDLHYDKDEILEAYLNEVYLGQSGSRAVHGFGLASQYYFAQPINELKLHQVALLAGMVKGPSYYDPRRHPKRAKQRRDLVLKVLQEQGVISMKQRLDAEKRSLGVVKQRSLHKGAYPAYLDLVKRQLREEYPEEVLSSEGLKVFTSLDPMVQANSAAALANTIDSLQKRYGKPVKALQGGIVVTDPQTGEVLALVGGKNARYQGFNRALDARRPIGSLVKPAVFLAGLENGYTLASLLDDQPISVPLPNGSSWIPQNFDRTSHGKVPLFRSLAKSYNQSTAQLGMDIGLDNVVDMLERLGIEREPKPYPSLLLGAESMSPFEIAQVYQTIAANGFRTPMRAIRLVTDAEGQELSRYPFEVKQVVSAENMHLIQYALQAVTREGTARSIYNRLPAAMNVAGKTGTSNGQRDSWFAGFAGDRMAVVWLGLDENGKLPFTGSGGALRVWTDLMVKEKPHSFMAVQPEGIEYHWVEEQTGLLAAEHCEGVRQLPFIKGTAPKQYAECAAKQQDESLDWFKRWFR
ncbi:penicillin-binding protein 1B [Neptuniibacter sp.]|uniref:penicillin-binding protein 1B n=1 Tax=Neptuniibacter sp. TaxID=1962643 RepID=UPI0026297B94|nr:penicillin-binding protein 1B [Neptuniibacter sp.]MCP4597705.1 penicillin-binding protein 1B [Neptuniibacter sp.]